ncbi:MAG: hypothetical protein Q7I99_05795 [Acholeplasmataceae bacterium]|nr:hypothetical protein [Acholeplasmataceae bacterium]
MKFFRKYAHTILFLVGLIYMFFIVINSVIEHIILRWGAQNLLFSTSYHLFSYMTFTWYQSLNIFWIMIYVLLIIVTFPRNMASNKTDEIIPLTIGFLIGCYLTPIVSIITGRVTFRLISYIEHISIIALLLLLIFYARKSFSFTKKESNRMKFVFLGIASLTFLYRFISWNLIGGHSSIYGYSLLGGLLISGILIFVILNKETIEVNQSKDALLYGSFKLVIIASIVYFLKFATNYWLPGLGGLNLIFVPIEISMRTLFIHMLALCFYSWIIFRSIFNVYNIRKAYYAISIALPVMWIIFGLLSIHIYPGYFIFSIPVYSMIIFGFVLLYKDISFLINERRWNLQLKQTIELTQYN